MEAQFSVKTFLSTALIAVGLAVLVRVVKVAGLYHWVIDFPVCFVAGALLGAGTLVPFKRGGAWRRDWVVVVRYLSNGRAIEVVSRKANAFGDVVGCELDVGEAREKD